MKLHYCRVLFSLLALFAFNKIVYAETDVYKCTENGKISFSQIPCKTGSSELTTIRTPQVSSSEVKRADKEHQRQLVENNKLQKAREKSDAKEAAQNRTIATKYAAAQKRCDTQQQKVKWAKEDLANTQPQNEMKARQKLKRIEEKAALGCQQ